MWGGALLIVAGAFVLCQVLGGDALGRLGITGSGTATATWDVLPWVNSPSSPATGPRGSGHVNTGG